MVALSLQTLLLMEWPTCSARLVACLPRSPNAQSRRRPAGHDCRATRRPLARDGAGRGPAARPAPAPCSPAARRCRNRFPGQARAHARRRTLVMPVAEPVKPAEDLTRIQGIDAALAAALGKLGITRYEQIAAWMRGDIGRIEQSLGKAGRANRENWIEQAQILAKGGETRYASRRARGETANAEPAPSRMRASAARSCRPWSQQIRRCARRLRSLHARRPVAPLPSPPRSSHRNLPLRPSGCRSRQRRHGPRPRPSSRRGEPRRLRADGRHRHGTETGNRCACRDCRRPCAGGAGRADASGRTDSSRQPAAHQRHRRPDRATPRRPGRHPLFADRALVAVGRRALRAPARHQPPHPSPSIGERRRTRTCSRPTTDHRFQEPAA